MKKSPIKRKTPLRKVSPKRAKENRIYMEKRAAFLKAHPYCQIWMRRNDYTEATIMFWDYLLRQGDVFLKPLFANHIPRSTEIHHTKKPKCKYLNDESTWLAASHQEHVWVENHKGEARRLGLLQ